MELRGSCSLQRPGILGLCTLAFCLVATTGFSGVLLQGFYFIRDNAHPERVPASTPSLVDGTGKDDWWDHLAKQAEDLRKAGFSAIWLPCMLKGGSGKSSSGYDPFDDYDIGSKNQMGTLPTHFGSREELERCVAIFRACGIDVYIDIVDNHRDGDPGGAQAYEFRYADALGNPTGGRFEKTAADFHHQAPPGPSIGQDPNVYEGAAEGERFGRDLAPINGLPKNRVFNALIDSGDWLTRALDIQGYRIDDVKGISPNWLLPFLNSKAMRGKFSVGEFWSSSDDVEWWINNSMQGRVSGFDYPLHFVLRDMCEARGLFDMEQLDHAGLVGRDPLRTVTFVENHDTDQGPFAIVNNKTLAYAYILTSEGYPCVYYRDYSSDPGCYGLHQSIDNLIWIHEKLADGPTQQRWKDPDVFAYERMAGRHLLVGLNDNEAAARTITVDTGFGKNVRLHDYTGHQEDVYTNNNGQVTLTIPKDSQGQGFVCYSVAGQGSAFAVQPFSVTQDYEGAKDLDLPPARNAEVAKICRVFVASGKQITTHLKYERNGWSADSSVELSLFDPAGKVVDRKTYTMQTNQNEGFSDRAKQTGYYRFELQSKALPASGPNVSYTLSVTYTAPSRL